MEREIDRVHEAVPAVVEVCKGEAQRKQELTVQCSYNLGQGAAALTHRELNAVDAGTTRTRSERSTPSAYLYSLQYGVIPGIDRCYLNTAHKRSIAMNSWCRFECGGTSDGRDRRTKE